MGESMETRLALGRHIEVGNLYDVRQDKELIDTIFKASPDAEQIECKDLGLTEYKYVVTKSTQDKLQLLNIHGELSASLMGGLIEVSGSASYLKDTRKKMNSSSMTCRLNVQTKQEKIFLRADDLRAKVDMSVLENHPEATHVVTSVLYGATGLVEAKFEFSDAQEEEKIKGSLGAKFQKMGMKIEGQIDIETDQHDIATDERFSFSWKCDVMDDNSNLPVTFEEAVKKMTSLPSLIKGSGDGKGVPLKVWLMPLSQVAEMFKQELQAHAIYQTISGDSLVEIMSYYTKLENNILELKDIVHDLTEDKSLVHSRKVQEAQEALTAGEKEKAKLQGTLKQALLDIRSGKSTTQDLDEWIIQFQESVLADSRIQKTKNEFRLDVKNKKFMTEARKMGVMVLTEDDYLPDNLDGHDFVLYTDLFTEELQDTSNEHRKTFMQLRLSEENKKNSSEGDNENNFDKTTKFYWQDFNLCGKEGEIKIEERKYGNIIDSDVKQRYKDELGLNLVDMSSGSFWDAGKISKDAVDFKIRCPRVFKKGKTACSSGLPAWQCKFCKDPIIFDTRQEGDNKIGVITCKKCMKAYKVPITTDVAGLALFLNRLLFKCNDTANHGFSYEKYDDNDAKDFQAQMAKLVNDIMEKRGEIPDYFDGLDLDGDNKLTPDEARPLLERLQALEIEQQTNQRETQENKTDIEKNKKGIQEGEQGILANQQRIEVLKKKIFFSAWKKSNNGAEKLNFSGNVTFNHIEVNEGGGLNAQTGVFRAPEAGTYGFSCSSLTGNVKHWTRVDVYKGGRLNHAFHDGNSSIEYNNIGASWMFKLRQREEVCLQVVYGKLHASSDSFVHFTGWLLKADE